MKCIYSKTLPILMLIVFVYSCRKDFLDRRPLGELDVSAIANKAGVEKLLIGAYSMLDGIRGGRDGDLSYAGAASNWIFGSICGNEAYKGSDPGDQPAILTVEQFLSNRDNPLFQIKWEVLYDGVQRANDVLRIMGKAIDISPKDQKRISAEAKFLRAHYHFEALKMWKNIPFIDEKITYENRNYQVGNQDEVWPLIEKDLQFAVDSLDPISYNGAVGRANRYTALALLAKSYVYQKKFESAKALLNEIIQSNRFRLVSFRDNFDPSKSWTEESIFSVQTSVNDFSGGFNGNYGDRLNFPRGLPTTAFACCGFFSPSQYLVNRFKTDQNGLPDLENFNEINVTSDEGIQSGDSSFKPYSGFLDPRLDWTVGRRGIPYLDFGVHPGMEWITQPVQDFSGPYNSKKNAFSKDQESRFTDATFWSIGSTANNVNLIRYADVLLWAAEVEALTGNPEKARYYVNLVRERAADSSGWVKKSDGTNAANYKVGLYPEGWTEEIAINAIRFERALELAMEGHRFFDLVRWGIAAEEIGKYLEKEKTRRVDLFSGAIFTKGKNELYPIPQKEIDLSAGPDGKAKMIQNPGY